MEKKAAATVSFCLDFEKEKIGYYFDNAPSFIHERFMAKAFSVGLISYSERLLGDAKHCSGEIDADEFFDKLKKSNIKEESFFSLFLDHGKNFLPAFKKWESINKR